MAEGSISYSTRMLWRSGRSTRPSADSRAFWRAGARMVRLIYLPAGKGAKKQGVDDYLASGHTVDELLEHAAPDLKSPPHDEEPEHPYRATPGALVWEKPTQNGSVPTTLTNFTARIKADVSEDDGAEVRRYFGIEARIGERTVRFDVPAPKFTGMAWATEHLGASAILYPGFSLKDHTRTAVQLLSEDIAERTIFTHTGWRRVDGIWHYLHGGGAIGPDGAAEGIEVRLDEALSRYRLPAPPEGEDINVAIRASLRTWEVAP